MPAGSKVHPPLAKVQAIGDLSGSASKGTYLKRVKKISTIETVAGERNENM